MKKILLLAAALMATLSAYAQGEVNFANIVISGGARVIDAPVFNVDGTTKVAGSAFLAQMWAGPNEASLAPVGTPVAFLTGTGAGYFQGGKVAVPGVAPGANAAVQVRAWDVATGATWDAAVNRGQSTTLTLATGGVGEPPSLPANLTGLASFSLVVVPEPSTIALGLLGAAALIAARRRK